MANIRIGFAMAVCAALLGVSSRIEAQAIPDLTVSKSHPGSFLQGQVGAQYTIIVSNVGTGPTAGPMTISDTLPAGLTPTAAAGAGWVCNVAAQNVSCSSSNVVNAGASYPSVTLTVNVAPAAPSSLINTVTVSGGGETNTANNSASDITTIGPGPDLIISKTSAATFTAGQSANYSLTVSNTGTTPTSGVVTVSDNLPAGLAGTAASGTGWTCSIIGAAVTCTRSDPLAAGASYPPITLTLNVSSSASSPITNTATVAGGGDVNSANNSGSVTKAVTTQADLSMTKADSPDPVAAGANITYTLTLSNGGPSDAQSVQLSDVLPAGTTFFSASQTSGPAFTLTTPAIGGTGTFTATVGTFASGATATFTLVVTVSGSATGTISNTATASTSTTDPTPANNSDTETTTVINEADLSVIKTGSPDPVDAGANIVYTLTLSNGGLVAAQNVVLSDAIPAGTTFVSVSQTSGPAFTLTSPAVGGTGTFTATAATLAGGASATFRLEVNVGSSATGAITNTATAGSSTTDPNPSNNSDTETISIATTADLAISKTVLSQPPFTAGEVVNYLIQVTNSGPATATNVSVIDALPSGAFFVSAVSSQGSCSGTGPVNCALGSLAPSASAQINLAIQVPEGTVVNSASVTADQADPNGANDADSVALDAAAPQPIPLASPIGLAILGALLAAIGVAFLRTS